jgi:hypothetical protein
LPAINFRIAVVRQLAPLLGGHVIRSAEHLSRNRQIRAARFFGAGDFAELRNSQVEQLHHRLAASRRPSDHYVFRLEVAMDNAHRMRGVEHAHHGSEDRDCL